MGTIQRWKKEVPPTNSVYVIENCDGLSSISNKAINVSPDDDAVYAIVKTTTTQECPRNRPGIVGTLHKIRSYLWLLPLIHNEFWISAGFSLIQPFFPDLATSRKLPAWKYGFVFSTYKAGMLLGSILAERMLKMRPPTTCYLLGQGGFFLFLLVFGSTYWIRDGDTFLGTSLAAVIIGGATNNMYLVSMFAVVTTKFGENSGIVIGSLEFLWGTGNMVGSYLGGILIDLWEYPLPFFVLGVIVIATFPVIVVLRRNLDCDSEDKEEVLSTEEASVNYWWLLLDPVFLADMFSLMIVWAILGFNEPTLEPSLTKFGLTSSETGTVYTVQYGFYACGCVIAGIISHFKGDCWCMVLGQCLSCAAFIIIAPAPFVAAERQLWNVYVCQAITGLGTSWTFICAYSHAIGHVARRGYPSNIRTNGFVSSCVFSILVLGGMIAPPLSGYIFETYGYQLACLALSGFLGAWVPVMLAVWIQTVWTTSASRAISGQPQNRPGFPETIRVSFRTCLHSP
ncbi:MFS-type transporter SLC18B1-like [Haemaphysalis longicornis]